MTRSITTDFSNQLAAEHVQIAYFFEGEFTSSPMRLWSGIGDFTWDGKTWSGNGWLQGISGIGETNDIKATNMDIMLAGIPSSVLSLALNEAAQNKPGKLWIAFLADDGTLAADPYLAFEGKFDCASITDATDNSSVTFSYETELVELEKAEEQRYTDVCQKGIYPEDKGLEYVTTMADWDGFWVQPEKKNHQKKTPPPAKPKRRR